MSKYHTVPRCHEADRGGAGGGSTGEKEETTRYNEREKTSA